MKRVAFVLSLCLGGAVLAQAPPPGVPPDAPPKGAPGVPPDPLLPPPDVSPPPNPPVPPDERDFILLDEPVEGARVDAERRVVLEGNVRLRYRGYRIRADRVTFDDNHRNATFEGNVVLDNGQFPLYGDYLSLDLRTRAFSGRDGRSVIPPQYVGPNLLQPLRLSGRTLTRIGRDIVATEGFLTTCDFPNPHYKIGFRKATLIPNRRIALRDVVFYLGSRRLLRVPYLAIPLTDRAFHYSYVPQVGRTEEEGVYVKAALGYALREALPGILRIDLMQKKGIGLGFDQSYRLGAAAGTLLLYTLRDQNRGVNNLSGRLSHQQKLGSVSATITSDFQQHSYESLSTNSTTRNTTLSLTRAIGGTNTSLTLGLSNSDYGFGASSTNSYTFTQSERLGVTGNVTLRLNGSQYKTPGFGAAAGTSRKDETGDLRARARLGVFDLDLAANKNLVGNQGGSGFFSGTERLPEITLGTDTFRFAHGWLRKLPLRITTGYGKFIEGPGSAGRKETDRALLSFDANPGPLPIGGNLSLGLSGALRQNVYGNNTAQYVLSGSSNLTQKLGGTSLLNFTYGYLRPYGFAPLRADQSGSFNNAGANLAVNGSRVRLTLFTGYDIQRARSNFPGPRNPWQNLALQLALRPSALFQTRFTGSYDINSGRLREVSNRMRLRVPGGLALDTGLRFDPQTGKFPQINGALASPLFGGLWNLSALSGYNGFTRRFEYKNFAVVRSWHDYELTFTYVDQPFGYRSERGFNLLFRLKALPVYQRAGVGQFGTALDTGTGEVF